MTTRDEDPIQTIWKSQPVETSSITVEQLRARAARFEAGTRRRNRIDFVSFALVAPLFGIGAVTPQNALVRAGALLLTLWAAIGLHSARRFHRLAARRATDSNGSTCVAWYRQQLERQRDVALSRPWGIALAVPGFGLLLSGYVDAGVPGTLSVILAGSGLFLGVWAIVQGRILAAGWQQELDSLQSLQGD
jgi:hypothetical protein